MCMCHVKLQVANSAFHNRCDWSTTVFNSEVNKIPQTYLLTFSAFGQDSKPIFLLSVLVYLRWTPNILKCSM